MHFKKLPFSADFMASSATKFPVVIHRSVVGYTSDSTSALGTEIICDFYIPNISLNLTIFFCFLFFLFPFFLLPINFVNGL